MTSKIGTISKWNDEKGFGFITPKNGGKSVFLHINDFSKKHKLPGQGRFVIYSLSKDKSGVFAQLTYTEYFVRKG